jgi:hypothetical protein
MSQLIKIAYDTKNVLAAFNSSTPDSLIKSRFLDCKIDEINDIGLTTEDVQRMFFVHSDGLLYKKPTISIISDRDTIKSDGIDTCTVYVYIYLLGPFRYIDSINVLIDDDISVKVDLENYDEISGKRGSFQFATHVSGTYTLYSDWEASTETKYQIRVV